jgi:hypothetical protein
MTDVQKWRDVYPWAMDEDGALRSFVVEQMIDLAIGSTFTDKISAIDECVKYIKTGKVKGEHLKAVKS